MVFIILQIYLLLHINLKNQAKNMDIPSQYHPKAVEDKWYRYWTEQDYFHSEPDERAPYTIVIPPPNVTGVLHMGHVLNNTIQDVLIRRARLKGYNACWVPGTDHASIATEAKVVAKLREEGIRKSGLSREAFLEHAWEWTHKHGGIILEQLKKLGCSCDWKRIKFTMDEDMYASVIKVFVDLYDKGLIYRGYRMVNWDPEAKTTLSDEEVIYEEREGLLYHLAYPLEGSDEKVTIATTRPETILGDTAICIHPEDGRYRHLKGKKAVVPICNRVIPIIEDTYVTMEFGTGCLKVTPAHDVNDKELGDKHKLEIIDIFNEDATLNHYGLHYEGKDRFAAREAIVKELKEKGYLVKTEKYTVNTGTSERTRAVIEPRLSHQWFLKMKEIAEPALQAVLQGDIQLIPATFINTYRHWMENVRDWNISRQLWWGHRIPVYYYGDGAAVAAENGEEALRRARERSGNPHLQSSDLKQDEDALDTWFSSWIWPISVFNGILEPDNEEIQYYYPTNDLVTAPDILFFWVARMIMAGYEYRGEKPFENVYLTGMVRDKQRRKMSKSLGNSPDPLDLINSYGADGVRVGMLLSSAAGNDLMFDEELCRQGSGFANKIWNAFRLIKGWETAGKPQPETAVIAIRWYRAKLQHTLAHIEDCFEKYRISDALMATYKLIRDDFCSWFLEMIKPDYGKPVDEKTYAGVIALLEANLKLLHPFMPFLTEEIWQHIKTRTPEEALIIARWPEPQETDKTILETFEGLTEIIAGIRALRKEKQIPFKDPLSLYIINHEKMSPDYDSIVKKMGNISEIEYTDHKVGGAFSFRVRSNEYFIPLKNAIDTEGEIKKLKEELTYTEGFLKTVQKKLHNERFTKNAPEAVVNLERKKEADALAKIKTLKESLEQLQ